MIFFQKGPVAGKIWRKTQHLRMGLWHPGNKNLILRLKKVCYHPFLVANQIP